MLAMKTAFIAMSGGMDSAFSAYLLKEAGYRVVAFTFALLPSSMKSSRNPRSCCSAEATGRARRIADSLGIPHYVMDLRGRFEEHVITRFVEEYRAGRTPNPCVLCNKHIKFEAFFATAMALGADCVATGHYARVLETETGTALLKARDSLKDQSYFLYPIPSSFLPQTLFPLGNYEKTAVKREIVRVIPAMEASIPRESQDICFIPEGDYRTFLGNRIPARKGPIVTVDGKELGRHKGIHLFTLGQRRGLAIPDKEPLYVVGIRPEDNAVVVGSKHHMTRKSFTASDVNMLTDRLTGRARAKVRYRQQETDCSYRLVGNILHILFDSPVSAVTPGQSVVLYDGDRVLGGGVIQESAE